MKKQVSYLSVVLSLLFCSFFTPAHSQGKKGKPAVTVTRYVSASQFAQDGNPMVVVTVTIHKNAFKGHGRIEETFSSDLQPVLITSNHAAFRTAPGKAIFEWNNIQEDREISVSYSLKALAHTPDDQTVSGQFIYEKDPYPIPNSNFTLKFGPYIKIYSLTGSAAAPVTTNTLEDLYYIVFGDYPSDVSAPTSGAYKLISTIANTGPMSVPTPAASATPVEQKPVVQEAPKVADIPAPAPVVVASSPNSTSTTSTPAAPTPVVVASTPPPIVTSSSSNSNSSGPNPNATATDLIYRIQLTAVSDKSKIPSFLKQYKITDQPYEEAANSTMTRILIGKYATLSAARARVEELKGKGLTGPYVVPYYMGKRITFQEAASHTQQ